MHRHERLVGRSEGGVRRRAAHLDAARGQARRGRRRNAEGVLRRRERWRQALEVDDGDRGAALVGDQRAAAIRRDAHTARRRRELELIEGSAGDGGVEVDEGVLTDAAAPLRGGLGAHVVHHVQDAGGVGRAGLEAGVAVRLDAAGRHREHLALRDRLPHVRLGLQVGRQRQGEGVLRVDPSSLLAGPAEAPEGEAPPQASPDAVSGVAPLRSGKLGEARGLDHVARVRRHGDVATRAPEHRIAHDLLGVEAVEVHDPDAGVRGVGQEERLAVVASVLLAQRGLAAVAVAVRDVLPRAGLEHVDRLVVVAEALPRLGGEDAHVLQDPHRRQTDHRQPPGASGAEEAQVRVEASGRHVGLDGGALLGLPEAPAAGHVEELPGELGHHRGLRHGNPALLLEAARACQRDGEEKQTSQTLLPDRFTLHVGSSRGGDFASHCNKRAPAGGRLHDRGSTWRISRHSPTQSRSLGPAGSPESREVGQTAPAWVASGRIDRADVPTAPVASWRIPEDRWRVAR